MKAIFRFSLLSLALSLCFSTAALAAEASPKAGDAKVNSPAKLEVRTTKVSVSHTGTDTIGIQLATRLKELFNASNLFALNEENTPKIRIVLTSKAEFNDRPHVGSVYSLLWVFSQSDSHLGYLLAQDVDVLSVEDVNDMATRIVNRTDGLAIKYGYLFK